MKMQHRKQQSAHFTIDGQSKIQQQATNLEESKRPDESCDKPGKKAGDRKRTIQFEEQKPPIKNQQRTLC
jgi:hypothetical protein